MRYLVETIFLVALAGVGVPLWAVDALPSHVVGEAVEEESRLMLDDLPSLTLVEDVEAIQAASVERAKAELEGARAKQKRWVKLWKAGVLSQVEAESTTILVARALVKYQVALATKSTAELDQVRGRFERGEISEEEWMKAQAEHQSIVTLATVAAANLQRELCQAAEAHLGRQRRLHAWGLTSRSQLQRAENALAKLQAPSDSRTLPVGIGTVGEVPVGGKKEKNCH